MTQTNYISTEGIVFIDFYAVWCGPCKIMDKMMPQLEKEYDGKITFQKIDVDLEPGTAQEYHVRSIPTIVILKDGEEVTRWIGVKPPLEMKKILDEFIDKG